MNCSTLIGVPASGGAYAVRWLHWGGDPEQIIPPLRRIWQHTFARHKDTTAHAITAATTPTTAEAETRRQAPWLRGTGTEFDLMWAGRQTHRPHRLRRDADGLLLLDVDVPVWSWWLLPAPPEGAAR